MNENVILDGTVMKEEDWVKEMPEGVVTVASSPMSAEEERKAREEEQKKADPEYVKVCRLARTIFAMCDLAGFHVEEHIVLKSKRNGKVYR